MSDSNEYAATFAMIDIDGDGRITAPELQQLMESLGAEIHDEFAEHAIQVIDTDGDGLVSLEELTAFLRAPNLPEADARESSSTVPEPGSPEAGPAPVAGGDPA
jgi:Ca2+-binding EF-hand superfamily protein